MGHINVAHGVVAIDHLRRRQEVVVGVLVHLGGQMLDEIEDARVGPLVLAERLIVHEQVADEAIAVDLIDPAGEFLGR